MCRRIGLFRRSEGFKRSRVDGYLCNVPLIALSAVGVDSDQPMPERLRDGRTGMDAAVVRSVSRGEQRVLDDTVHHRLCFDRPDAVVRAIRDVVARASHT